ncbi:hypothetical protein LRS13_19085 [Svornostia abyssi]|uniref:Integral membrane protein n=1 Tax=Svornostia abyssi TaxID=2898438 RepID=A0ABY5PE36_9ACTN|nr:hypothetical protein LRS13_19085 [Parviterribacteraceae bacterium J379]
MSTAAQPAGPAAFARPSILRPALLTDAVVSAANGVVYLVAAGPVGELLGLSPGLLRGAGAFFLVYAAAVMLVARTPRRGTVLAIVIGNAVWAIDSMVAAVAGWGDPTTTGTVWIVLQGLIVGAFAVAQAIGRREL